MSTTGDSDIMQITFAILCFGIVLLEFLWCPREFYQGYTIAFRHTREVIRRSDITAGVGRCEDSTHIRYVRIVLLSGVIVDVCPFKVGFAQI